MLLEEQDSRAVTPVVATVLLVAVIVILVGTLAASFFGVTEKIGGPTGQAAFEYAESPVGLEMTPTQIGQDVTVEINGKQITTFETDDAGETKLIPTSPGDQLTVIAADGSRSVLVSKTIDDRDEIGDFVAHYTFAEGSGSTLVDQSGNDNDGTIEGDPDWLTESDAGLKFDGTDDYVTIDNLDAGVDVDEFTIAVAYKQDAVASDEVNQLVEHRYGGNEWFLETRGGSGSTYQIEYAVEFPEQLTTGYSYNTGNRRVAVGTYDGSEYGLYMDSDKIGTKDASRPIGMDDMKIAVDSDESSQFYEGEIYEIRLYYSAFDDEEVESITKAMS